LFVCPLTILVCRYGQPDTISTMLEYGIHIDAENVGWTALHLAALNGHLDIVSILLNKGASSSIRNREGKTALDIAREEGQERIAAIIIETEFQSGVSELPSPPPTPPSAPPIEFFGARGPEGTLGTLEQWRVKLQRDLEEVSNDDSDSTEPSATEGEVEEVTLRWKSFEEEKVELLQQLERSRLKEILRLRAEMERREERVAAGGARAERQTEIIHSQVANLREGVPRAQEAARAREQNLREDITQLSVLLTNCAAEAELVEQLRSHQVEVDMSEQLVLLAGQKREAIEQLVALQARHREELEALKREKYSEVEMCEAMGEREVARTVAKIAVLEQELESVRAEGARRAARHREAMAELGQELEAAERQRVISKKQEDEDQFACPVCLELLVPPLRIFQCPEGHILCENCKENPALVHCPQVGGHAAPCTMPTIPTLAPLHHAPLYHAPCTIAPLHHAPLHHAPLHHAPLHHCTIAPLYHCTIATLHHCTIAPLHHCTIAPSPQCRVRLERNCSRNRALEEVARTFFPQETTSV